MTTQQPLGQRLRAWREANGLSIDDVAQRLDYKPAAGHILRRIEDGDFPSLPASIEHDIEALIRPNHTAIVEAATEAIKAGLERGATVVRIVHCTTAEHGRVVIILGDDDDPDWRREL